MDLILSQHKLIEITYLLHKLGCWSSLSTLGKLTPRGLLSSAKCKRHCWNSNDHNQELSYKFLVGLLTPRLLEAQDIHIGLGSCLNEFDCLVVDRISLSRNWRRSVQRDWVLNSGHLKVTPREFRRSNDNDNHRSGRSISVRNKLTRTILGFRRSSFSASNLYPLTSKLFFSAISKVSGDNSMGFLEQGVFGEFWNYILMNLFLTPPVVHK